MSCLARVICSDYWGKLRLFLGRQLRGGVHVRWKLSRLTCLCVILAPLSFLAKVVVFPNLVITFMMRFLRLLLRSMSVSFAERERTKT